MMMSPILLSSLFLGLVSSKSVSSLGSEKCTQGPSYWCASKDNANECDIENPTDNCAKYCDNLEEYSSLNGSDLCDYGDTPDATFTAEVPDDPLVGSDKCTQGPSYWCASEDNADECDIENPIESCAKYCGNTDEYPSLAGSDLCDYGDAPDATFTAEVPDDPLVGSDRCTQGPSYWCASEDNADECDIENPIESCAKYCDNLEEYSSLNGSDLCDYGDSPDATFTAEVPDDPLVGSDKCTQGPSYWCASEDNADECDIENPIESCAKYCGNTDEYPSLTESDLCDPLIGSDKCTQGPSYWCASEDNANECDIENPIESCTEYCGNAEEYPSLNESDLCDTIDLPAMTITFKLSDDELVGSDPCTYGPSYWCASQDNAAECGFENAKTVCSDYCGNQEEYPSLDKSELC